MGGRAVIGLRDEDLPIEPPSVPEGRASGKTYPDGSNGDNGVVDEAKQQPVIHHVYAPGCSLPPPATLRHMVRASSHQVVDTLIKRPWIIGVTGGRTVVTVMDCRLIMKPDR